MSLMDSQTTTQTQQSAGFVITMKVVKDNFPKASDKVIVSTDKRSFEDYEALLVSLWRDKIASKISEVLLP